MQPAQTEAMQTAADMHVSSPSPPGLHYHRYKLQQLHLAALHFFTQSKTVVPTYKTSLFQDLSFLGIVLTPFWVFSKTIVSRSFPKPMLVLFKSFPRPLYKAFSKTLSRSFTKPF